MADVAIIGGGLAGLSCALRLKARGRSVVLHEAAPRLGGRVTTLHRDGFLVERGPAAVLDDAPTTHALLDELGLKNDVIYADPAVKRRYLFLDGKLSEVPSSPPAMLTTSLLSFGSKLRVFAELAKRPRSGPDESMASFFRRHFGDEITTRFVDTAQAGIYAGDIDYLSAHATFPGLVALERSHGSIIRGLIAARRPRPRLITIKGGLIRIVDAIAQRLGDVARVGSSVRDLAALDAKHVVLAAPARAIADMVRPLDQALGALLGAGTTVPMVAVALGFRRQDVAHSLDGFGLLVGRNEAPPILGSIFYSSAFPSAPPDHVLLRVMIGGARDQSVATLDEQALVDRAVAALGPMLGFRAAPVFTDVARWPHAIEQYAVGHLDRLAEIERRGLPHRLRFIGASYRGVGVNDVIRQGWELGAEL